MAVLQIPERYSDGLLKLLRLSTEALNELIAVIERVPPKRLLENLAFDVVSQIKSISADDLDVIIRTLVSLYLAGFHNEMAPSELAQDVIDAMEESNNTELRHMAQDYESFKPRLIKLFQIETLLVHAKALEVLQENENTFCDARILTDIRPVFGSEVGNHPKAAVIVHQLYVSYYHEGELKKFYVALDTGEINVLRKVLDRADLKAQSLRSVIEKAGVAYLDAPRRVNT